MSYTESQKRAIYNYRAKNRNKINSWRRGHYVDNKSKNKEYHREYYRSRMEALKKDKEAMREYRQKTREASKRYYYKRKQAQTAW